MANHIIKSVVWVSAFRVLGILSAFLINVVLAHMLDPDILGQYFLAFSMAMFLSIIMMSGSKQTSLRLVSKARLSGDLDCVADTIKKVLTTVFISIIVVAIIMLAGIGEWLGVEMFHSEEIAKNLAIIIFWASLLSLAPPIGECLKALRMPGWGAAVDNSVSNFIALTVFSVLYILGQSVSLQNILIISSTAVCVVLIVLFRKLTIVGKIFRRGASCITICQVYIEAYPVFLINLSTYIATNASIWVVAYYMSHEHVAIYGVVLKLFNLIAVPLLIINLAIEPSIAEYIHENKRKYLDALLRLSATAALVSTSFISAIIFIWGDWILSILFGNEFISGYTTLKILVIGNIVNVWTGSCASMMLLGGYQKILMSTRLFFGVTSILISLILVTPYGIEGVALAVSISLAISNLVAWWIVKNKMRYDTSATLNIKNRIFILRH